MGLLPFIPVCLGDTWRLICFIFHTEMLDMYKTMVAQSMQFAIVHFCMAFVILSETEFYRRYMVFARETHPVRYRNWHFKSVVWNADADAEYRMSREPWSYVPSLSETGRAGEPTCQRGSQWVTLISFSMVYMFLHWAVKSLVKQDPRGFDWRAVVTRANVLFKTEGALCKAFLGIALLRVVRQAAFAVCWKIVGLLRRWEGRV